MAGISAQSSHIVARQNVDPQLADADIAEQLASGNVVVVAGRPNLAESAEATVAALPHAVSVGPHGLVLNLLTTQVEPAIGALERATGI